MKEALLNVVLFEPLASTKPLGLGLGLVTARTLLVGQGGQLTYEETPPTRGAAGTAYAAGTSTGRRSTGATFCVRLPVGTANAER